MDLRRFYVIGAATGEHGPYSTEELAEAARSGEVTSSDQVRTALGTRVGTVGSVLGGADARQQESGEDSGVGRRTGPPPLVIAAILGIVIAIAGMVVALRPSDADGRKDSIPGPDPGSPADAIAATGSSPPAPQPRAAPPPIQPDAAAALTPANDDAFADASALYALRRVRAGYSGPLVRIRRDSDGREMDVGAQKDGSLDGHALVTFCGSSLGSVACWYDQGPAHADFRQVQAPSQPHIFDHGMLSMINHCPTMHFKRPDRWLDTAAKVGTGTMMVVLTCDEKERFAEFQTVLGSASKPDHAYLRGASGRGFFDAMNHRLNAMHIDGAPGFACSPFARLKLVAAELGQPAEADTLRLGNDGGWTKLRGWNGSISEVVIFPETLSSDRLKEVQEALMRHFSIATRH